MIKAIRITDYNIEEITKNNPMLIMGLRVQPGHILAYRPNDTIVLTEEEFDYQYAFAAPESSTDTVECRVKDTPEARAELLEIQESRDELKLEITIIVEEECPYDYVPHDVIEIITNKLIEKGWRND